MQSYVICFYNNCYCFRKELQQTLGIKKKKKKIIGENVSIKKFSQKKEKKIDTRPSKGKKQNYSKSIKSMIIS